MMSVADGMPCYRAKWHARLKIVIGHFCPHGFLVLRGAFPLRGFGKPPGPKSPKKRGKITTFPDSVRLLTMGKSAPKKEKWLQKCIFFFAFFPQFRGSDRGGEFCNFSPFFEDCPLRGKRLVILISQTNSLYLYGKFGQPPLGLSSQDKFDHDKGQKSAVSGRRLHWRLSTGFFAFSPVSMCNLVWRIP